MEARKWVEERELFLPDEAGVEDDDDDFTQFPLDCEDDSDAYELSAFSNFGSMKASSRNPLSKLDECDEEDEDGDNTNTTEDDADALTIALPQKISPVLKLSSSMKRLGFVAKSKAYHTGVPKGKASKTNYSGKASEHQSGSRSANELLPPSTSFVKVSDMGPREWSAFLDKFQELLPSAFRARKHTTGGGPRQMPRLGTSCQF
jgi:hypothetical protein